MNQSHRLQQVQNCSLQKTYLRASIDKHIWAVTVLSHRNRADYAHTITYNVMNFHNANRFILIEVRYDPNTPL